MTTTRDADRPIVSPLRREELDAVASIAEAAGEHAWDRDALEIELAREVAHVRVARAAPEGPVLAYALWWEVAGELSLLSIATASSARRRGLARALVARMLEEGRARGAIECFLDVRVSNAPAIALYERFGFERWGERAGYYADGEDAWVMRALLL